MDDATLGTQDKANVATEFNQLVNEVTYIFTAAKFNNTLIFGTSTVRNLAIDGQGLEVNLTVSGALNSQTLASITTAMTAATILSNLSTLLLQVTTQRASLGAIQAQLIAATDVAQTFSTNASAAESRIRNTNIAQESANFAKYSDPGAIGHGDAGPSQHNSHDGDEHAWGVGAELARHKHRAFPQAPLPWSLWLRGRSLGLSSLSL